ncbi:hypothetical protein MPSEU_001042100 [Mayamaea pseudoterrestris]|nr:hypothetical protein MPSEU_001042100 [Mayamaea pseudoterrestris]
MIRERFQSQASSPSLVKRHAEQQAAHPSGQTGHDSRPREEPDWIAQERKRKAEGSSLAKKLHYHQHERWSDSDGSVEVTDVRKPPTHPATPPRVQLRQHKDHTNNKPFSTSGIYLPYEQERTGLGPYFPGNKPTKGHPVGHCLIPTVDQIDDPNMFSREKYIGGSLTAAMSQLAHFGAYAVPPTIRMGPPSEDTSQGVYENYALLLPGIISKAYCVNVLSGKQGQQETQQAGLYIANELEAASHSTFPTCFRPSFESDAFFRGNDHLRALQTGAIGTGETLSASNLTSCITPFHFITTITSNGTFRLPADGFAPAQLAQLIRNMGWWIHLIFHFPSRFRKLREISSELSPFLLASPMAGHLFWLIDLLTHHPTQQAWTRLPAGNKLRATEATLVALQRLFKIFIDWSQNYFPEEHCVPVLLWAYPERSDVSAFDSSIRMRDWKPLKEELATWRQDCTAAFNVTVFTSTAPPSSVLYSRPLPPYVLPARQQPFQPPHQQPGRQLPGHSGQQPAQQPARQHPQQHPQPDNAAPFAAPTDATTRTDTSGDSATGAAVVPSPATPPRPPPVVGPQATVLAATHTSETIARARTLREQLPPFPVTATSCRRRKPPKRAPKPAVRHDTTYWPTLLANVWKFLDPLDVMHLRQVNPFHNHPIYGSTVILPLDNRIHWRRMFGWGKASIDISSSHDAPSPHLLTHLAWGYLTARERHNIATALNDDTTHRYATLRHHAVTTPLWHLREPRYYPKTDMSAINESRVYDMGAALLRCDFNYGDLLRWLGGIYTHQNEDRSLLRDAIATLHKKSISPRYPPVDFAGVEHIIAEGVPIRSVFTCPFQDVARREKENNRGLEADWINIMEKYRKEEKLSYHIMFLRFLWAYVPGLFLALLSYIPPKEGRLGDEGRLINDPSTPLHPDDRGNVNRQMPKLYKEGHDERQNPKVHYGTVIPRMLKLLWNLRLDHPHEEIYMAADDISAAFRWLHYHPDIAVAFGTVLDKWLVIPVGQIFGGVPCPGWYMKMGELRSLIAATLDIGQATTDLSDNIILSDPPSAAESAGFGQSLRDRYNQGTRKLLGPDYKFGFSSFVDDQGVAAIGPDIREAVHRSVIAASIVFGDVNDKWRGACINAAKWQPRISHQLHYLGLDWDSRRMEVGLPLLKQQKLKHMLHRWRDDWSLAFHPKTVLVPVADKATILGLMRHGGSVADLADYLSIRLQQSLTDQARKADAKLKHSIRTSRLTPSQERVLRRWWRTARVAISEGALADLQVLHDTLDNPAWAHIWRKPIGLMVEREPTNTLKSDASTKGVGAFNVELEFMWRLHDGDLSVHGFRTRNVQDRPIIGPLTDDDYHINVLEFAAIIINVVLTIGVYKNCPIRRHHHHILNVLADNTSALSWMRHAARCNKPHHSVHSHSGKPHSRQDECRGGSAFSLHTLDSLVGIRYHAGNAGIGDLQSLPCGIQTAYNNLISNQRHRPRGDVRSGNDRTFDQRASHFGKWSLKAGFNDESFRKIAPGQEIPVIASYLYAVAAGETSLEIDKRKAKGETNQPDQTLMVKTLVGYLNAAHALLETFLHRRFSIDDPRGSGLHPVLADILASRRKWQQAREKREPYTHEMFSYLFSKLKQQTSKDVRHALDIDAAVFDWTCLGAFTGSRANEYAQTTAKRGCFSKVPANADAGEWAGQPLAFVAIDFTFYTKDNILLSHAALLVNSTQTFELRLRFRYDKSQNNFTIRRFRRSGHAFICPIAASLSILKRAKQLHKQPVLEPLGVFRKDATGAYEYLQSRDIIKVMRQAVVGAYPDKRHYLRSNITRIVAHSNRVTAAVALQNAGLSIEEIAFRLRWSPPSVQHYLRESTHEVGRLTMKAIEGAVLL